MTHGRGWQVTAIVIIVVCVLSWMMGGDYRALIPLTIISGLIGGIGSLMLAKERARNRRAASPPDSN